MKVISKIFRIFPEGLKEDIHFMCIPVSRNQNTLKRKAQFIRFLEENYVAQRYLLQNYYKNQE